MGWSGDGKRNILWGWPYSFLNAPLPGNPHPPPQGDMGHYTAEGKKGRKSPTLLGGGGFLV